MTACREKEVLALQSVGALGAYNAGAHEALCEAAEMLRWVARLSIAPINAANQPEHRVSTLREFWQEVSSRLLGWPLTQDGDARRIFNETSAALSAAGGVPDFFDPRIPPTVVMPQGTQEAVSVYEAGPFQATIKKLVDFDFLHSRAMQLSMGAGQVLSGNLQILTQFLRSWARSMSWQVARFSRVFLLLRSMVSVVGADWSCLRIHALSGAATRGYVHFSRRPVRCQRLLSLPLDAIHNHSKWSRIVEDSPP